MQDSTMLISLKIWRKIAGAIKVPDTVDTGDRICMDGAPALAMFKKTVSDEFEPAGVTLPMIYEVDKNELQECLEVIHKVSALWLNSSV